MAHDDVRPIVVGDARFESLLRTFGIQVVIEYAKTAYGFQVSNLIMETLQKLYMSYRV